MVNKVAEVEAHELNEGWENADCLVVAGAGAGEADVLRYPNGSPPERTSLGRLSRGLAGACEVAAVDVMDTLLPPELEDDNVDVESFDSPEISLLMLEAGIASSNRLLTAGGSAVSLEFKGPLRKPATTVDAES